VEWHSDPVEKVDTGTMGGVLMCSRWMHVEVVPLYIIPLRALNHNRLISRRLMRNPLRNLIPIALRTYRSSPIWHQPVLSTCLFSSSVHSRSLQLTSVRLRSNPLDCVRSPSTCLVPSSFLPTLFYLPSSTASFLSRPNIPPLHAPRLTINPQLPKPRCLCPDSDLSLNFHPIASTLPAAARFLLRPVQYCLSRPLLPDLTPIPWPD